MTWEAIAGIGQAGAMTRRFERLQRVRSADFAAACPGADRRSNRSATT
jgi:hypothetical protein